MSGFPDLREAFPHTSEFLVHGMPTLHDVDFQPHCGYVSLEEAELLHDWAALYPGVWLEIGAHTGWSGAHIAASGVELIAVEPQFATTAFRRRTLENWERAGVLDRITPIAATSAEFLTVCTGSFAGVFVDGDHDTGAPLRDAQMAMPHLADKAVILFHDAVGQPVEEAIDWVEAQGFLVDRYPTMAKLTACWRGGDPPA